MTWYYLKDSKNDLLVTDLFGENPPSFVLLIVFLLFELSIFMNLYKYREYIYIYIIKKKIEKNDKSRMYKIKKKMLLSNIFFL